MSALRAAPFLLATLLAACGPDGPAVPPPPAVRVEGSAGSWDVEVEIAATARARERGLMERTYLPPDRGMLFLYAEPRIQGFWMKNCLVPIDAAYVDASGRIVNVVEMVPEPGVSLPRTYPSVAPVRLVLEMPGGWFRERGLGPGDRVRIPERLLRLVPE